MVQMVKNLVLPVKNLLLFDSVQFLGSIPGLERYPGEGNGYPLQYSCLENFMDKEAWQAMVCGVTETNTFTFAWCVE